MEALKKKIRWAQWIARFDMEDLISSILRKGILASIGLLIMGLILERILEGHWRFEADLQGTNLVQFMEMVFHHHARVFWPILMIHSSLVILLLTSYVRVLASCFYFFRVARSYLHALLSVFTILMLTYILFW